MAIKCAILHRSQTALSHGPKAPMPPSQKDKLYRLTGKVTFAALTIFLGLAAIAFVAGRVLPLSDHHYINFYPSPSGSVKAALIIRDGGGAISPHCSETIIISPATASDEEILMEELEVYSSSDCSTFSDHTPSPVIEWLSDTKLKIAFSLNGTAASMKSVKLRKQDASGHVAIEFSAYP